jgi:hypothetical protein
VRALRASGNREQARAVATEARARLAARAACISDPALRESYLRAVPENAETRTLCDELLEPS